MDDRDAIDQTNQQFYDQHVSAFDRLPFPDYVPALMQTYLPKMPGKRLLEIGSATGALAKWIESLGFSVLCLEPAPKMAEKGRSQGLTVIQATIQNYQPQELFDGVVAFSSLIHVPKTEFPAQLKKIAACLQPNGLFFISLLLGAHEGLEDPTDSGHHRYFAHYTPSELEALLHHDFRILEEKIVDIAKMKKQFILMVLKPKN